MQNTAKQYLNGQLKSGQSLNGKGSYVTKILSIENGEPKTVEITKIKNVISAKQNGRPQDVNINDPDARLVFRHQGGKWRLDEAASKMGSKSKYSAKIVANFYDGGGEGVPTIAGYAKLFPDHPVKIGDTWQPDLTGSLFRFPGKTTCKLEDIREIDGVTCAIFTFKGSGRKTERLNVSGIPNRPLFVNMTGNANHEGRVVYIIESGEVKECKYVSSSDAQGSNAQAGFGRGGRFKATSEDSAQVSMVKIGGDTEPLITKKPDYSAPPSTPGIAAMRVITVGGNGRPGKVDGKPEVSVFRDPYEIAIDKDGNAIISEHWNHDVRKISAEGYIASTVADNFQHATGLGIDPAGNIYVTRYYSGDVTRITPDGRREVVQKGFFKPSSVRVDGKGNMWVAISPREEIVRINPQGIRKTWKNVKASHIALGPDGSLYFADYKIHCIRRITPNGEVKLVAGKPGQKGHRDGSVAQAQFQGLYGITVSPEGNVYVTDGNAIRRVSTSGMVSTIAGHPEESGHLDGPPNKARFTKLSGLALDRKGNLWVTSRSAFVYIITNVEPPAGSRPKPSTSGAPDYSKGLVAYYPFNGNAKDESGNGHDGEVKGATLAKDRHGGASSAYSFDGQNDFIEVTDSDSLDLGNGAGKEWTVTIWFKGDIKREGWLLRKGGGGGSGTTDYGVLASPNPVHRGFIWGTGRSSGAGGNDVTDWMAIPSNVGSDEWHHVVATYKHGALNEGFKIFYIDGQVAGSTDSGKLKNSINAGHLLIGSAINRGFWLGSIDDVRIYNRAFSEEQVKALYEFEKPKK